MNREEGLKLNVSPTVFMEFHGSTISQLAEVLEIAKEICDAEGCLMFSAGLGRAERDRIFKARHELGEMIVRSNPDSRILVMDVAVPISAFPDLIRSIDEEMKGTRLVTYFISHAGNGNVHFNILGRKGDRRQWDLIEQIVERLVSRSLQLGGTATGEHGIGLGKRKYMAAEHGSSLVWMKQVKALFDPNGILNPGKIFP
jgi:D-lactate dehydrogenase (cytochrome)